MLKYAAAVLALLNQFTLANPVQSGQDPELDTLRSKIEKIRADSDIPGVAVIIVKQDGLVWLKTFGVADRESGKSVDGKTIFRIGSITKMFTGLVLLIAQEDGLLRLDDEVKSIMPDFPYMNRWEKTHPVKVAHFLEHTSGLPGLSPEEFNLDHPMSLKKAILWKAADRQTLWPPGRHHSYSNAGPGYAAYLLEQVTGKTYETYVTEKIFKPLEMDSASFFPDERTLEYLATGYDTDGHKVIPYWHMFYRAFGAINVRPRELAPFIQLLLNRGVHDGNRLISAESIERMETPKTTLAARSGLRFGYGIGNYTYLRKGNLFHGHGGDGDGYLARLGYSRDLHTGYFLVINAFNNKGLTRIRHLIEDMIIGDRRPPEPPVLVLPAEDLEIYTGTYEQVTQRFQYQEPAREQDRIRMTISAGKLLMERKGKQSELIPVTTNHFRYQGETVATSAFVFADDHYLYFQDENNSYRRVTD